MKNFRTEALILSIGLFLMGALISKGLTDFSEHNRSVKVKGLAEIEVPADKVVWPLSYKMLGNNLPQLYNEIKKTNEIIITFLNEKGIGSDEITVNAPSIVDMKADRYNSRNHTNRYNVTSVVTVSSRKVDLVRQLITEQGELLKKGVAIVDDGYNYNVKYEYTQLNKVKPKMLETATKNARVAAQEFAKHSDSRLGNIIHAYQGQFSISDRDENTPYIKNVRVVCTVDYALEN